MRPTLVTLLLLLAPSPALACLPPPPGSVEPPPPTVEQRAEVIVRGSETIVYGVLTRSTEKGDGRLRIIHVYKGDVRPGTIVTARPSWGFDPPMCAGLLGGPPPLSKGSYGVFAWSGEPTLDAISDERLAVMFDRGWLTRAGRPSNGRERGR